MKQTLRLAACIAGLLAGAGASAQVHRCTGPDGSVAYSDKQCDNNRRGGLIERQRTQREVAEERSQARAAEQRKQDRYQAEAERAELARQMSPPAAVAAQPQQPGYAERLRERNAAVTSVLTPKQRKPVGQRVNPPPEEEPPAHSRNIQSCQGSSCADWNGTRYTRNPVGGGFKSDDGRACTMIGRDMVC